MDELFASVGLRVSGSHWPRPNCMQYRNIACHLMLFAAMLFVDYATCALGGPGDEAIK